MPYLTAIILSFLFLNPTFADPLSDKDVLLAKHKEGMDAHKNIDLEKWLSEFKEGYISANRGVISYPTPKEMKTRFRPYINSTTFEYYRDMVPPIVKVSEDGTLGWVIVQVEAKGLSGGQEYEFQSAWIELYEKRDGHWVQAGNVSNMKE